MNAAKSDRNLLVGALALQFNFINELELVDVIRLWLSERSASIENLLCKAGKIDEKTRIFLATTVGQLLVLATDSRSLDRTFRALSKIRHDLDSLNDADISFAVNKCEQSGDDLEGTVSHYPKAEALNRFAKLRFHAKGGLGVVSIAFDRELNREVALKEIKPDHVKDQESLARFQIEAEVTGGLEHPGIVPVYSLGEYDGGEPFYVMRFIKGETLKQAITEYHEQKEALSEEQCRMALRRLVRRLIDVCNAIEYAHSRGVLHRDIKPGNVMLGKYGETLVVDWGLAKTGTGASSDEPTLRPMSGEPTETYLGAVFGTPEYMSPEQISGEIEKLGPTSDVYSLGATLYHILTGQTAIPRLDIDEAKQRVLTANFPLPREVVPDVPKALEAICLKAMALEQLDRYQHAIDIASDLELWVADEPVSAYQEPMLDRSVRWIRKHKTVVTSSAAALLTGLMLLCVIVVLVRQKNFDLTIANNQATLSRDEAIEEREKAERYLQSAKQSAISMLTTAEEKLSQPIINGETIRAVRQSMTEIAFETFQQLHAGNPSDLLTSFQFAQASRISSNLYRLVGDLDSAEKRLSLSFDLQNLIPNAQRSIQQKDYLAESYRDLATTRKAQGRLANADLAIDEGYKMLSELIEQDPQNDKYRRTQASLDVEKIGILSEKLELEAALAKARSASTAYKALVSKDASNVANVYGLLFALAREVKLTHQLKRRSEFESASASAIATGNQFQQQFPIDSTVTTVVARMRYWTADGMQDLLGVSEESIAYASSAVELTEKLSEKTKLPAHRYAAGDAHRVLAVQLRKSGKLDTAAEHLLKARGLFENVIVANASADNLDGLARCLLELAITRQAQGDSIEAKGVLKEALAKQTSACEKSPESLAMKSLFESIKLELEKL